MEQEKFSADLILCFTIWENDQVLTREIFSSETAAIAKVVHFSEILTGALWQSFKEKKRKKWN